MEIPFEVSVQWLLSKIYENSDKFLKENQNKILGIKVKSLSMEGCSARLFKFASKLPIYIEGEPGTEKLEMAQVYSRNQSEKKQSICNIDCALSLSTADLITNCLGMMKTLIDLFSLASQGTLHSVY